MSDPIAGLHIKANIFIYRNASCRRVKVVRTGQTDAQWLEILARHAYQGVQDPELASAIRTDTNLQRRILEVNQ